ncbi:TetR/AcrR family transcriptional regulator [Gordonia sp. LSe1-13]|uniref:TetR/AcrR family transcriptional regulator n=1 Tax=Gordonia sesuvii TaxID=3116777 RepID=A0ABU7MC54_9ACTN|nr:TetR/AcrR family transcriptional regulator [Gordonia sp. LSe1-13]
MPDSSSRRGSRLTVDDWLNAAMQVLISDGVGAIKISRLCERLGVTKGSFYWHFTDISALMTALSDHCRAVEETARQMLADLEKLPPIERIQTMGQLVSDTRRRSVEAAVRAWAETDPTLEASVVALDHTVFDVARTAFVELGFSDVEAHARATALVYVGIGYMQGGERVEAPTEDDKRIFVEMLTRR